MKLKLVFAPEAREDMENIYHYKETVNVVAVFDCRQNPEKMKKIFGKLGKDIRKIKRLGKFDDSAVDR